MLNFLFGSPCEKDQKYPTNGRCATKYNRKSHPNRGKPTWIPKRKGKENDNCVPATCDQRFRKQGKRLRCNNKTATCYYPGMTSKMATPMTEVPDYVLKKTLNNSPKKVSFQIPLKKKKVSFKEDPPTPPQSPKKRKTTIEHQLLKITPPKTNSETRELVIQKRTIELMPLMARYSWVKVQVDVLFSNNMQVTSAFRSEVEQVASDLCAQEKVAALLLDPNAQEMATRVVNKVKKETGTLKIEECLAVLAATFENMPYEEFLSQLQQNLKGGADDCKARMMKHLCGNMDFAMESDEKRLQYNQNKSDNRTVTMGLETLKKAMDNKSDTEIFRLQAAINPAAAAPLLSKITPIPQEVYDLIRQQTNSVLMLTDQAKSQWEEEFKEYSLQELIDWYQTNAFSADTNKLDWVAKEIEEDERMNGQPFDPTESYDFTPEEEPLRPLKDDEAFVLPDRGERGVWKKFGTYMIWILLLLASSMSFSSQVSTQRVNILPERPDSGFAQLPAPDTMDLGDGNTTPLSVNLFGQTPVPLSETAFKFGKGLAVTASMLPSNSLQFNNDTMADVAAITQNVTPGKIPDISPAQNALVRLNDQRPVANATEVAMNTGGLFGMGNLLSENDINKTAELVSSDALVLEDDDKPMDLYDAFLEDNNYEDDKPLNLFPETLPSDAIDDSIGPRVHPRLTSDQKREMERKLDAAFDEQSTSWWSRI